jgi:hypothetical protein
MGARNLRIEREDEGVMRKNGVGEQEADGKWVSE